jgi:thiosulfate dehydrogenase [quinone] large subunit
MTARQQVPLVMLRTLIGWHFLYEGYSKLLRPAWGPDGVPLDPWSAAGYLRSATGPLAGAFHALATSPWIGGVDMVVAIALVAIGVALMLGLFTQLGCAGAMVLLMLFYVSAVPTSGVQEPRAEGAYLFVNKTLIELAAVVVIFSFKTGHVAGLDRWWASARPRSARTLEEVAA